MGALVRNTYLEFESGCGGFFATALTVEAADNAVLLSDICRYALATLRHMKSIPGVDYQACRDQAFLRARDLIPVMRSASELDKWIGSIGRGAAGDAINKRLEALFDKIHYRFRQFDVGLDQVAAMRAEPAGAAAAPAVPAHRANSRPPFQVALSFAGEQRDYVRQVAENLKAKEIEVFYDEFEAARQRTGSARSLSKQHSRSRPAVVAACARF